VVVPGYIDFRDLLVRTCDSTHHKFAMVNPNLSGHCAATV
jgi:hypothetical protein